MSIRVSVQVQIGVFWVCKLGPVRVLQNFGSGSSQVFPDPGGFGSDVKKLENNRITKVSETGLGNSTQCNHIIRFGSGFLYPN